MPLYVTSVTTPWTSERVFSYLADLTHFAEWDPGVVRAAQVNGDGPGQGATYDVTVRTGPREMTLQYRTTLYAPNERIEVLAATSTLRSFDTMTIRDLGTDGSVVTYRAELSLKGVLAIGTPLLALSFRRIGDRAASGLRRVLEGVETTT